MIKIADIPPNIDSSKSAVFQAEKERPAREPQGIESICQTLRPLCSDSQPDYIRNYFLRFIDQIDLGRRKIDSDIRERMSRARYFERYQDIVRWPIDQWQRAIKSHTDVRLASQEMRVDGNPSHRRAAVLALLKTFGCVPDGAQYNENDGLIMLGLQSYTEEIYALFQSVEKGLKVIKKRVISQNGIESAPTPPTEGMELSYTMRFRSQTPGLLIEYELGNSNQVHLILEPTSPILKQEALLERVKVYGDHYY